MRSKEGRTLGCLLTGSCFSLIAFYSSQLDSLRTWKVFASVFANQLNNRIENKRVVLSDSTTSLVECTKHIDSPSFHYITFLTLSNIDCTRSDLIQLSRLTNLGMLTVRNDGSSCVAFEDNIIRAWGRGASEAGAFTRLRILVCRFQFYITGKIFAYFQTFPALDLVLLDQCRVSREFTNHAKQHEWHAMRRSKSHGGSFAEESPAWKEIYKGLTKEGALFDIDSMQKPSENDEGSQPVLEVSLYSTESHRHGLSKILEPDDMWHFRRKGRPRDSESSATLCPQKRVLVEGSAASSCTSKRPALRTSRQRPVKNLLSDYQV